MISIRKTLVCIALTLCSSFFFSFSKEHFEIQLLDSGLINNETQIYLYDDTQEIGFVSYTKMPLLNWYVMHTFYVHPEARNKGYGTKLLVYTCDKLQDIGAQTVYIQPGPFELIDGRLQNVQLSRELKIKKLVSLYKRCGFIPVHRVTQIFAYILYKCSGIDEDPAYLLYMNLSD